MDCSSFCAVSRSLYAAFRITSPSAGLAAALARAGQAESAPAELGIWTTTPWTLPANLAVAVNDKLVYALARQASERQAGLRAIHYDFLPPLEVQFTCVVGNASISLMEI